MKNLWMAGMMITVLTVACKKKGCMDPVALNYNSEAEKQDKSCQYDYRGAFMGDYQVADSTYMNGNLTEAKTYTLHLTTGGTKRDTVFLNNLFDSGMSFIAFYSDGHLLIPSQEVSGSYYIQGDVWLSAGEILMQTIGGDYSNRIEGSK